MAISKLESVNKDKHPQTTSTSIIEHIEILIVDLLGIIVRFVRTLGIYMFRPARAAEIICQENLDYQKLLRPYTFLFVGCLLYSFLIENSSTVSNSNYTTEVLKYVALRIGNDFSFSVQLLRTLPNIIIMSLFATIASMLFRIRSEVLKMLFIYLYGFQGSLLFLLILIMPLLASLSEKCCSSDNYVPLVMLLIILASVVQNYRAFRHVISITQKEAKVRLRQSLLFPLFFFIPLHLASYIIVISKLILNEVKYEIPDSRDASIRIFDIQSSKFERDKVHIVLTALVHNKLKFPFIIKPNAAKLELYLVPNQPFYTIYPHPTDNRVIDYNDLEVYEPYTLNVDKMYSEIRQSEGLSFLLPDAATVINVTVDAIGSSAYLKKYNPNQPQLMSHLRVKSTKHWNELANGRSLFVRLIVQDSTLGMALQSECFRVKY